MVFRGKRLKRSVGLFAGIVPALVIGCGAPRSVRLEPRFAGSEAIAEFSIDGAPARIHTQGLFVTDAHYYVTGRLETEPRRALLLRIDRGDPRRVEHIEVTGSAAAGSSGGDRLDHPGGFDFDGRDFWIPVSASHPGGTTVILRVPCRPDRPLADVHGRIAFRVADHVGALAVDRWTGRLYGANWDTETIYVWDFDGTELERIPRGEMVPDDPGWALAVQDFKGVGPDRILAGGVDKSEDRPAAGSRAVIELLDVRRRVRLARVRLESPPGTSDVVTREGLAVLGDHLFLLPRDLGREAAVLRYHLDHRALATE